MKRLFFLTFTMLAFAIGSSQAQARGEDFDWRTFSPSAVTVARFNHAVRSSVYLAADKACVRQTKTLAASKACMDAVHDRLDYHWQGVFEFIIRYGRYNQFHGDGTDPDVLTIDTIIQDLDEDQAESQERQFNAQVEELKVQSESYAACLQKTDEARQPSCEIALIRGSEPAKSFPVIARKRLAELWKQLPRIPKDVSNVDKRH